MWKLIFLFLIFWIFIFLFIFVVFIYLSIKYINRIHLFIFIYSFIYYFPPSAIRRPPSAIRHLPSAVRIRSPFSSFYRHPIYCWSMLSCLKLTNAHTVRSRPTLKNDTKRFRNRLVRDLKEKGTKLSRHSMTSNTHRRNDIGISGVYV